MTTIILGAGGFIGQSVVKALSSKGYRLKLFDIQFPEQQRKRFECITGDFSVSADVERVIGNGADTVIHLISTTVPVTADKYPIDDVRGNLLNTLGLLKLFSQRNIRRIIFVSSGGTVYGPLDRAAKEGDFCRPVCSYGIVKRAIEDYLALYFRLKGIEYLILRIGNAYGASQTGDKPQGVIGAFLHRILKNQPIEIWGDGNVIRDFIHVDDVAKSFVAAMQYSGPERIFNVGTGKGYSINEVIELIESTTDMKMKILYRTPNTLDVPKNILDISLIRQETGWKPTVSLPEGISQVYREICKNEKSGAHSF